MADEPRQLSVVEHETYEIFELADEEQIIAEISGRVTEKFVYELKGVRDEKGQPVVGLSYSGTNWACREYAKRGECIRVVGQPQLMVCPVDAEYIIAVVTVQRVAVDKETGREVVLDSTFGIKRQWRKMKKWKRDEHGNIVGEEIIADTFYWEKAVSKAIRNGKQGLIPTDVVKQLIGEALKMKNAVRETRGPGRPPSKPAPAPQQPPQPQQTQPAKPPMPAGPTNPPPEPSAAAAPAAPAPTLAAASAPPTPPTPTAQPPAPPSAPAPQTATPPPTKQPPAKPAAKPNKETLVQRFAVVLGKAFNTQDDNVARQFLKALSGTDKITDFTEEDLNKYGRILQGVVKGQNKVSDDKTHIIEIATGTIVWGPPAAPPAAPASAPPGGDLF